MKPSGFGAWMGVFWALAAGAASVPVSGPVSEKVLAEQLKFYASISTLDVDFKQVKTLKDMNLQLKSEGHLTIHRPDSLLWEITRPSPISVSMSRDEVLIRSGVAPNVQTQSFKRNDLQMDSASKSLAGLISWLNLDSKALSEQYDINATGQHVFHFTPKVAPQEKNSSPFQSLDMELGSGGQLKHLTLHELSGDLLEIEFGKPKLTSK